MTKSFHSLILLVQRYILFLKKQKYAYMFIPPVLFFSVVSFVISKIIRNFAPEKNH